MVAQALQLIAGRFPARSTSWWLVGGLLRVGQEVRVRARQATARARRVSVPPVSAEWLLEYERNAGKHEFHP